MVALRKPAPLLVPSPHLHVVVGEPVPKRPRADALPEDTDYRDTGCELSASCLACPLRRCKYDAPPPRGTSARDREIVLLRTRYRAPVERIAETYGISRRSVFRILREAGHGRGDRAVRGQKPEVR